MNKYVLVIDDEEAVRNSFALALEDTDYEVETVDSGEKGIEKIKQRKPDLVFLDLKMPGMNGVETLREIRKMDPVLPVYIVTAFIKEYLDPLNVLVKQEVPFEILNKPIGADQILAVTTGVLERVEEY